MSEEQKDLSSLDNLDDIDMLRAVLYKVRGISAVSSPALIDTVDKNEQ